MKGKLSEKCNKIPVVEKLFVVEVENGSLGTG